jgi:hypothetical protein
MPAGERTPGSVAGSRAAGRLTPSFVSEVTGEGGEPYCAFGSARSESI